MAPTSHFHSKSMLSRECYTWLQEIQLLEAQIPVEDCRRILEVRGFGAAD